MCGTVSMWISGDLSYSPVIEFDQIVADGDRSR